MASIWTTTNPRPDSVRAWVALRVVLLSAFGGAHAWGWFAIVAVWMALDYAVWMRRRGSI